MERRDFLTLFASAAAAAGVSATPLAGAVPAPEPPLEGPEDIDAYVERMDRGLARIGRWTPGMSAPGYAGDREAADALARASLQSIFVTGMLGDLPVQLQTDERVQERVWHAMPVMDEAHDRMSDFVRSRSEADLDVVHEALRRPGVRESIIEGLDAEAARTGVSARRRAQLREMLGHVTWRMANQPPALMVSEYSEKVARIADTDIETEARQRQLAARAGEEAFWNAAERSTRDRRIRRGGRALGIGFLITGIGGAIVAAGAMPGVFIMTVGVIWMLIGLVILLVGLATGPDAPKPSAP